MLQSHLLSKNEIDEFIERDRTLIEGNVKAIIPMFREKLLVEHLLSKEDETTTKTRYKRGV